MWIVNRAVRKACVHPIVNLDFLPSQRSSFLLLLLFFLFFFLLSSFSSLHLLPLLLFFLLVSPSSFLLLLFIFFLLLFLPSLPLLLSFFFCQLCRPPLQGLVSCWLLNVPATCECISGTDLLRQFYVLPHWDRSCRSNSPPHPVTVCWHWADQSQRWPYNVWRLAG